MGEFLGRGGKKDVYAFGDNQTVAVMRDPRSVGMLVEELNMLKQIDELGPPVLSAKGPASVEELPAATYDRYAFGVKENV